MFVWTKVAAEWQYLTFIINFQFSQVSRMNFRFFRGLDELDLRSLILDFCGEIPIDSQHFFYYNCM